MFLWKSSDRFLRCRGLLLCIMWRAYSFGHEGQERNLLLFALFDQFCVFCLELLAFFAFLYKFVGYIAYSDELNNKEGANDCSDDPWVLEEAYHIMGKIM